MPRAEPTDPDAPQQEAGLRAESRVERKERTRRTILDAELALAADSNLAAISLQRGGRAVLQRGHRTPGRPRRVLSW